MASSGEGSTNEGAVKAVRSKGLQLHHLPPDILRGILSRLTLKEAVRMSILSKKFKRIWKHHPKLVFTRATMRSRNNAMAGHQKNPFRTKFIRGVNSVLRQLKSADLCKFVIKFGLRERHTRHINRWVDFSAASRAGSADTDNKYSFPLDMFNASGFVSLILPSDFCGFKYLKKLSLHKVIITGEVQCLLPECSILEWLSITFCKLVGLSISQHLSQLNVHAPNLSTFEFADNATIYLFSLSDCFDYVFSKLLVNDGFTPCPHSHLKTVHMTGFHGYHGQIQLALYILRNATCLECLVIDPM
ncbi:hypothetical protein BS78_06G288100, partial [Paspalum vaginatum]